MSSLLVYIISFYFLLNRVQYKEVTYPIESVAQG